MNTKQADPHSVLPVLAPEVCDQRSSSGPVQESPVQRPKALNSRFEIPFKPAIFLSLCFAGKMDNGAHSGGLVS